MLGQIVMRRPYALILVMALALGGSAAAEMYKSVDEDGNVVFSQTPPRDKESEVIKPRYAKQPASAVKTTTGSAAKTDAASGDAAGETPKDLTPQQIAIKKRNCTNAKEQLAQMQSPRANRLQYVNENNERAFLTEDQRNSRTSKAQKAIKEYCN